MGENDLANIKTAPDSCEFPRYTSLHELLQKDGIINHTSQSQELQVLLINNQNPDLTSQFKPWLSFSSHIPYWCMQL